MKRRDDRHLETRQQIDNMTTSQPAKDSVLMLQRDDIEPRSVEEFRGLHVVIDHVVAKLKPYWGGVGVGPAGVVHCDDAGIQIRSSVRDSSMEIVGEGRDPAATGQMISDERDTLESFHSLFLCASVP